MYKPMIYVETLTFYVKIVDLILAMKWITGSGQDKFLLLYFAIRGFRLLSGLSRDFLYHIQCFIPDEKSEGSSLWLG